MDPCSILCVVFGCVIAFGAVVFIIVEAIKATRRPSNR